MPEVFISHRDGALVDLWIDTGLRPKEMLNLTLKDIDFEHTHLRINDTKTKMPRVVPFAGRAYKSLRNYIEGEREHLRQHFRGTQLWLGRTGEPLKAFALNSLCDEIGKQAGITRNVYPYLFRHTFAVLWLLRGNDPYSLNRIMGHSSMQTTLGYVRFSQERITALHQKINPLDRL